MRFIYRNCKKFAEKIARIIHGFFGINVKDVYYSITGIPRYCIDVVKFAARLSRLDKSERPKISLFPFTKDYRMPAGTFKSQYFLQDLIVAQRIFKEKPLNHLDIGSRVDGFVAHLAVFMPVKVIDVRPGITQFNNITFEQGDLSNPLFPDIHSSRYSSISCLHALEHFGLARYGDPLDLKGPYKGLSNLNQLLVPGGFLYFSVPVGQNPRIEFNAHRVFSVNDLYDYSLSLGLCFVECLIIFENGSIEGFTDIHHIDIQSLNTYSLAIYIFQK